MLSVTYFTYYLSLLHLLNNNNAHKRKNWIYF